MNKLEIDACIGSEIRDTQGETLSVEGADISDLEAGNGRWNDNHGKGFFNSLGRVTYAKKVMKAEDAITDREKYYWDKVKSPYIYAKGYLYSDDSDHLNAKAAAAVLRNIHKTDAPLKIKASVEGGVVSRGLKDPTYLARTKIHSVALTFTPANTATLVEPLNIEKCDITQEDADLIKSIRPMDAVPSFIDISDRMKMNKIASNINQISSLVKQIKYMPNLTTGNVERQNAQRTDKQLSQLGQARSSKPIINVSDNKVINPADNTMRVKSATDWQIDNQNKLHVSRALKDPTYLQTLSNRLTQSGAPQDKVSDIVSRLKHEALNQHASMAAKDKDYLSDYTNKMKQAGISEKNILDFHNELSQRMKPHPINKALSAGYGGSGSPSSMTGGSVIQSESIGNNGFKYTTCDGCGDEQVYMKNQTRCRKCGKSFSLSKLGSIMELL